MKPEIVVWPKRKKFFSPKKIVKQDGQLKNTEFSSRREKVKMKVEDNPLEELFSFGAFKHSLFLLLTFFLFQDRRDGT